MDHPSKKPSKPSHYAPVVMKRQETFPVPQRQRSRDPRVEFEAGVARFSSAARESSVDEEDEPEVREDYLVVKAEDEGRDLNSLGAAAQIFMAQQDTRPVSATTASRDKERRLQSAFASSHGGGRARQGPVGRPSTAPAATRSMQPLLGSESSALTQPRASSAGHHVRQHGWWWWWIVENSSGAATRRRSNASRQAVDLGDIELQAEATAGPRSSVGGVHDDVEGGQRHEPEIRSSQDIVRPGTGTSDRQVALDLAEQGMRRCFLHVYFDWMRAICVVPDKKSPFRVMIWILLALISITQVLQELKREVLRGKGKGEAPLFYAAIGRFVIILVFRAYFLYIVWRFGAKITRLLGMLSALLAMFAKRSLLEHNVMSISVLIMLASVLIAFAQKLVYMASGFGWEPKEMLLFSSYDLSRTLFLWRQGDKAKMIALTDQYGYELNATTTAMGLLNMLWNVAGIIHQHFINDLGIMAAFTLRALAKEYCRLLDKTDGYTQAEYDELYILFKCMRAFSELMDCIFGKLFNLLHVDKFAFCTFFVFHLVYSPEPAIIIVDSLRFLYLVVSYYYVAADAATVNPRMRNWTLRNCPGVYTPFYENGVRVATATLLQDTAVNPIAVGSGGSIIDWPFVGRFVGGVGNLFGFFAEHRGDA